MRFIGYAVLGIVGLAVIVAGSWAYRYYTAEIRGIIGQEERVQSPLHRMGAYERFYAMCASVRGHEATLAAQRALLNGATDDSEIRRVRANIAGIEAHRARIIEDYNSRARMEHTQGQFRASDLPYQLNREVENTQC